MKTKTTLLFLLAICNLGSTLSATKIDIEIINGNQEKLIYYTPTDGDYYFASRKEEKTDATGKYTIEEKITKPGFYYIYPVIDFKSENWNGIQVYVTPDANISIKLDLENPRPSLSFDGDYKSINTFLGQIERHYYLYIGEKEKLKKYATDSDPSICFEGIQTYKNLELEALSKVKEVNPTAKEMITADIELYYQTAFLKFIYIHGVDKNESSFKLKPKWLSYLNASTLLEDRSTFAPASTWYMDHLGLKSVIYHANNREKFNKAFSQHSDLQQVWAIYEEIYTKDEMEKKVGTFLYHTMSKINLTKRTCPSIKNLKKHFQAIHILMSLVNLSKTNRF